MAKVFLDANFYIDVTKRSKEKWKSLGGHLLFISPISTHILFYALKLKTPDKEMNELQEQFGIVSLTKSIVDKSLAGPTKDFEDNVQLHSSADEDCDILLTNDKKLLDLKFFGKTEILPEILQKRD